MNATRRRPDRPDYRTPADVRDTLQGAIDATGPLDINATGELWRVLRREQSALRSSSGGGRPGGVSDPTAAAAFAPDPTRHALDRVEACVTQMRAAATELAQLRHTWLRTGATPAAEPEQTPQTPGCEVMQRVGVWAAVHTRRKLPNGKGTIRLSRWAADFLDGVGRLPTLEEAERHAQGRRVRVPVREVARR